MGCGEIYVHSPRISRYSGQELLLQIIVDEFGWGSVSNWWRIYFWISSSFAVIVTDWGFSPSIPLTNSLTCGLAVKHKEMLPEESWVSLKITRTDFMKQDWVPVSNSSIASIHMNVWSNIFKTRFSMFMVKFELGCVRFISSSNFIPRGGDQADHGRLGILVIDW